MRVADPFYIYYDFSVHVRAGAVGINLTNANRVFLLEPALNPSFEAQAVGRVYRLGQSRPVEIVHMHVKDSIETRISQLVEHKFPRLTSTDSSHGETAAAPLMDRANVPVTGSMRTDTASIFEDEFDFLFGAARAFYTGGFGLPGIVSDEHHMMSALAKSNNITVAWPNLTMNKM